MLRRRWIVQVGWRMLAVVLLPPLACAEIIRFKNGTTFRGSVIKRTATEVLLKLDFGTASFTPDEILSVELEPSSEGVAAAQPSAAPPAPSTPSKVPVATIAAPAETALTLPDAMKAIAFIVTLHNDGSIAVGSGTIISDSGTMVTNYHVVADAKEIKALLLGDQGASQTKKPNPYEARVLRSDACLDLAVVRIPRKTPQYLRFAESDDISVGSEVRAIGNPQGLAVSVSRGIVSAVRTMKDMLLGVDMGELSIPECADVSGRELNKLTMIQTDAAINPGNSGGPLLNSANEIVGINSFISTQSGGSEGLGFALHVKHVRKFASGFAKKDPTASQRR